MQKASEQAAKPTLSNLQPKNSEINVDEKCISIVKTVIERCKKEQTSNCLQVPLDNYVQRVSYYTGLPETYLAHVILKTEQYDSSEMPPKLVDLIVILKCLIVDYTYKKFPTLKEVFAAVVLFRRKSNMEPINFDHFCHQLKTLHFCERPTKNGTYLLIEDPKVTFERNNYLNRLEKYKSKDVHIYYLDERLIAKSLSSREDVMLFYAILINHGYVRGLYCTNPDKDEYLKWITNILLPLLIPSSLIVISDGPFHRTIDTNITRYHSKADMLKWLTTKNIPCSRKMHKAELYEIISKCCVTCKQSKTECVLKAHGFEVLVRPASLKDCTPTESFWNDMHSELFRKMIKPYDTKIQGKIETYIKSLTQLQWVGYEEQITKKEKLIFSVDQDIQEVLENYEFDTVACENLSVADDYSFVIKI